MELDLVHRRQPLGLVAQPLEILDAEVGDADRADAALVLDPFEGAPGVEEAVLGRHRPVDQVEVDMVEAEPLQALVEGGQGRVVPLLGVPELGGDEDLLARQPGGGESRAYSGLVAVGGGGVDMAIAARQRFFNRRLGVLGRDLENAKAELGDRHAIAEGDGGDRRNFVHHILLRSSGLETVGYPEGEPNMPRAAG